MSELQPALGVLLLGAYSYGVVAALHFGTRALARRCCKVSLSFPFWPLALATAGVWAFVGFTLVSTTLFTAGIGLILLQLFSSVALGIAYVTTDSLYSYCRLRNATLPVCTVNNSRGCIVDLERQAKRNAR